MGQCHVVYGLPLTKRMASRYQTCYLMHRANMTVFGNSRNGFVLTADKPLIVDKFESSFKGIHGPCLQDSEWIPRRCSRTFDVGYLTRVESGLKKMGVPLQKMSCKQFYDGDEFVPPAVASQDKPLQSAIGFYVIGDSDN